MCWEERVKNSTGCGPVQIHCISGGFGSLDLRQYPVLRLSLGCEKTCSGSKDGDQDVLTIIKGPMAWEAFYRRKKQASRHRSVP